MEAHSENIKRARISGCFTSYVTDDFFTSNQNKKSQILRILCHCGNTSQNKLVFLVFLRDTNI